MKPSRQDLRRASRLHAAARIAAGFALCPSTGWNDVARLTISVLKDIEKHIDDSEPKPHPDTGSDVQTFPIDHIPAEHIERAHTGVS